MLIRSFELFARMFSPIMFLEEFRRSIPEFMLSEIRLLFITISCESRRGYAEEI